MKTWCIRYFGKYSYFQRSIRNQFKPFRGCSPDKKAGWKRTWTLQFGWTWRYDNNFKQPKIAEDMYSLKAIEKLNEGAVMKNIFDGKEYAYKIMRMPKGFYNKQA